jgi:hypothetical protein
MTIELHYNIKKIIYKNSQLLRDNITPIKKFLNHSLKGGGYLVITYKDTEYKYTQINDDDYYILYSKDEFDCVSVIIDKENKVGEIHGIGNFKSCLSETNTQVGSTLLKITIKMLKKYKQTFGINKIILTDNSIKKCGNKDIILSHMLMLLNGDTWYRKYGFRPIYSNNYDYNKILIKKYKNNQLIINKITIKESNIMKYIKKTNNEQLIKAVKKVLETNETMLLKDFLQNILTVFDSNCYYFYIFYEQLYVDIGLENFHKLLFGLNI